VADYGQNRDGDSSARLAALAEQAVRTFREENTDAYNELVEAFDGQSANVAVFGLGKFSISVEGREVRVDRSLRQGPGIARGAIYPETLVAITEGRISPLESFFKGDLIARAPSADLHRAYGYFVRFSDTALRSERLQELLREFQAMLDR
jgi:hypothetical protein